MIRRHVIPVVDTNLQFGAEDDASSEQTVQRYLSGMAGCHVLKAVMVDTGDCHQTTMAQLKRASTCAVTPGLGGLPQGMVAGCDLSSMHFCDRLSELLQYQNLKGIRHHRLTGNEADSVIEHVEYVTRSGLVLEMEISPGIAGPLNKLACLFPSLQLVLDDSGQDNGQGIGDQVSAESHAADDQTTTGLHAADKPPSDDIMALAECSNVSVKVTGGASHVIRHISTFGTERVLLGSASLTHRDQRPADRVWMRYAELARRLSSSDRDRIFRTNAIRLYNL